MTEEKEYDLLSSYNRIAGLWEKQLNGLLYMLTDNKEFVRSANLGLNVYSRYLELFKKNQEFMASLMNIPTKKDIARVAKQSIQAEEKMDILEEQIWSVQDGIAAFNKENLEFLKEVVNTLNSLKADLPQTVQEYANTGHLTKDIQELKQGLIDIKILQVNLQEMKSELEGIRKTQEEFASAIIPDEIHLREIEFQDLKQEMVQLADIKSEIAEIRRLLETKKELVLSGERASIGSL
ncbi:hypothetical protein HPT25_14870 [Bacillus sp. BRMEA1]|uniref:hypothetical protein n=1 Tax=Neobacillus endophyticus TaxID=2738405 RepID=UPI00156398FA|nr:hypothetical protein [Neobacillus endophyticus]NRD78641.1 hypothetical protein [Neobacillus endophyticus]